MSYSSDFLTQSSYFDRSEVGWQFVQGQTVLNARMFSGCKTIQAWVSPLYFNTTTLE